MKKMFGGHILLIIDIGPFPITAQMLHNPVEIVCVADNQAKATLEEMILEHHNIEPFIITALEPTPYVLGPLEVPKDIAESPVAYPVIHKCMRKAPRVQTRPPPPRGIFYSKEY